MNKKQYLVFKAWTSIVAICFFIAVLIFEKVEVYGYAIGILLIGYFVYKAYKDFKRSADTEEDEQIIGPVPDAEDAQKIKFHKKILILGFIAFPALTAIIVYDLNSLESGAGQGFGDLAPILFIYKNMRYWPAVLFVPIIGILCTLVNLRKISTLKSKF